MNADHVEALWRETLQRENDLRTRLEAALGRVRALADTYAYLTEHSPEDVRHLLADLRALGEDA